MRDRVFFLIIFLLLRSGLSPAAITQEIDSTRYLLLDFKLQLEITDAVDHMYNFNFHKAEVEFNWMKYNYPDHPLPYFLFGISTWWQMMPNLDKESPLGEEFLAYMDSAIYMAEGMLALDDDNIEANFFLAGAYGFKGRYHSEKKNWGKAAGAGRLALKYLEKTKGHEDFSPEILFGDALFNYYSIWIRENYPMLRPILLFFPKGDKALGIKQMEEVVANAFYTRVESIYFLMRIKAFEEKKIADALRLTAYVHTKYPDNPYFHRFYARMLYSAGQYTKAEEVSKEILNRLEKGRLGYEAVSGRYASFFLGHINQNRNNREAAKQYFEQSLAFSSEAGQENSGYALYASLQLARYYTDEGAPERALPLLKTIRKHTKRKNSIHKQARTLEKEIKRKKRG